MYEYCNEIELQSSTCDPKLARERRDIAVFEANTALEQERLRAAYDNGGAVVVRFGMVHITVGMDRLQRDGNYYGPYGGSTDVPSRSEYYYEEGFNYPYPDPGYYPFPYLDQQPNYYHGARLGR